MSELTLDEAIKHCLEVAGEQQERADSAELIDVLDGLDVEACKECAADHRQLAEWLTELKELREKVSGGDVLRICELENYINAIYTELAKLFGCPCNFSPPDEVMLESGRCEDDCGTGISEVECWSRYFQTKFMKQEG